MRTKNLVAVMILLASQALWADEQVVNKYAVVSDSISQESPMFKQHIQEQVAVMMRLWEKGVVENIYLDREVSKPESKRKASIVFFVKAKNKDEANEILKQLPFVQHNVLNFELHPVGVLWLKQIEDHPELSGK
jgi:hypothetical protein